jgi:hypothetical protein
MSSLRMDMSAGNRICLARRQICPAKQVFALQKSRLGTKTINLGPDKLMTYK